MRHLIDTGAIKQVTDWLITSSRAVVLTGAGISTESGIPDFRSPGGIWSKYRTVCFDEFLTSAKGRYEYWRQKCEMHADLAIAQPNMGHQILAKWEAVNRLRGVITQNIDGLHQLSGSRNVLELHGTAREVACLDCTARYDTNPFVAKFLAYDRVPDCPKCGGWLKHATISFGQKLPPDVLMEAFRWTREADLLLVIGSSLVVTPAADLPRIAKDRGTKLVVINREPTPVDSIADATLRGSIGDLLNAIDREIASENAS